MSTGRVPDDGCVGGVEARIIRHCLKNTAGRKTDVLKGSRPTATRVADPPVFYVARDYSLGGEACAEMTNMRQVIAGLPETAMDHEEQREWSFAYRKPNLSELIGIIAVSDPQVENGWGPVEDGAQSFLARKRSFCIVPYFRSLACSARKRCNVGPDIDFR